MTRSKRMQIILRLAAQAEQDSAQRLVAVRRDLDEFEQKLEHLRSCRAEYMQELLDGSSLSMPVQRMQELRNFIKRLDEVIVQMESQRGQKQTATDQCQEVWAQQKNRSRVLNDITDRYRDAELKRDELKLQFEIDDRPRGPDRHS